MRNIEYTNPRDNIERGEEPRHTVEMINEAGEVMGQASIDYYSNPIPYYQVTDLYTEPEFRSQRVASEIMDWVENWLKGKKRAGFLVDGILPGDPAAGFYERRGWIPVPGGRGQYVFNLPNSVEPERFRGIEMRQTWPEDRGKIGG